jgi:hypothetical protein
MRLAALTSRALTYNARSVTGSGPVVAERRTGRTVENR